MGRQVPVMPGPSLERRRQVLGALIGAGEFETNLTLVKGVELLGQREAAGELGQGTDAAAAPSPVDLRPPGRLCRRKHTKAHFLLASRFPTGETLLLAA